MQIVSLHIHITYIYTYIVIYYGRYDPVEDMPWFV